MGRPRTDRQGAWGRVVWLLSRMCAPSMPGSIGPSAVTYILTLLGFLSPVPVVGVSRHAHCLSPPPCRPPCAGPLSCTAAYLSTITDPTHVRVAVEWAVGSVRAVVTPCTCLPFRTDPDPCFFPPSRLLMGMCFLCTCAWKRADQQGRRVL